MELKKGFVLRELGTEYIVCPEGQEVMTFDKMFSLNASAAFVWRRMEQGPFTREDLIASLLGEYDVTEERVAPEVDALLQSLIGYGVVNE